MPIVSELATLVKRRRKEIGLTQERLASLVGLSRATISQLETGRMDNLSLVNAEALANQLGYGLGLIGTRRSKDAAESALELASRTANVSFTQALPPEVLRRSLLTGTVAPDFIPQLRAVLDEAPVGVLSAVASELEDSDGVPARTTWTKMRALATVLGCTRGIWS